MVDTTTDTVIDTDNDPTNGPTPIGVGRGSTGIAFDTAIHRAYVPGYTSTLGTPTGSVTVIDTTTNTIVDTGPNTPGEQPITLTVNYASGVAVDSTAHRAYITGWNYIDGDYFASVSVIDTTTNTIVDTDPDSDGIQTITLGAGNDSEATTSPSTRLLITPTSLILNELQVVSLTDSPSSTQLPTPSSTSTPAPWATRPLTPAADRPA